MGVILYHKYEVLKKLAEGGIGCVYLARDLHLNKLVAVKSGKIPDIPYEEDKVFREAEDLVHKEKEVLKSLSHTALPQITDFFEERGNSYLVMEYVEGITLEQYLRKFGKVGYLQAVKWAIEIAEVLDYLHSQNPPVIYRDLKPSNIMIQPDGKIKLIDFGAATKWALRMQPTGIYTGTPGYSAPELWQGELTGAESDVFSLGTVLHEMLTGIKPQTIFMERRPVREYNRSIPKQIEHVVMVCTRMHPAKRYASMKQVKAQLLLYNKTSKRNIGWHKKGNRMAEVKRQEKSILLTEKKFSGWYLPVLLVLLCAVNLGEIKQPWEQKVNAGENRTLWVELLDDFHRKLLLQNDAIYKTDSKITLQIPAEDLPEGKMALQIIATGEDGGIWESRVFLIESSVRKED